MQTTPQGGRTRHPQLRQRILMRKVCLRACFETAPDVFTRLIPADHQERQASCMAAQQANQARHLHLLRLRAQQHHTWPKSLQKVQSHLIRLCLQTADHPKLSQEMPQTKSQQRLRGHN